MVDINQIKKLRDQTQASPVDCKKALKEAKGDFEEAKKVLRVKGKKIAQKKSKRETQQGIIDSYIHPDSRVGVLLDIRCESDFVTKSKQFKKLAHEICLQIAAMKPLYLKSENIPEKFLNGEKKIYRKQLKDSGKPKKIINEIIEGKLEKQKQGISLLSQAWIKDQDKTIKDLIDQYIAKTGENIKVKRFVRYEI